MRANRAVVVVVVVVVFVVTRPHLSRTRSTARFLTSASGVANAERCRTGRRPVSIG